MPDIICTCYNHLSGAYKFPANPRAYFAGKTIYCPKCNSSKITTKVHENPFTLKDAKISLGIEKSDEVGE